MEGNMKKLLKTFLFLMIMLIAFSLMSCSDDVVCVPCEDKDGDQICDRCKTPLVSEEDPGLTLELVSPPDRTKFYTGEAFIDEGMTVNAKHPDGTILPVEDYILGVPDSLDASVENVFVYYGGAVITVPIEVSDITMLGVADIRRGDYGDEAFVDGYFVGETADGFLIKDVKDDTVLEVRANAHQYGVGDRIRFLATLEKDSAARTAYLEYSEENTAPCIISSGDKITALFSGTTGVASWDRMTRSFKDSSFKTGTYYKIYSDRIYLVKNSDGSLSIHLNNEAIDENSIKPDGARTVNIVGGTACAEYLSGILPAGSNSVPGKCFSGCIYAVSLGCDSDSYDLTVLDSSWLELSEVMSPLHEAIVEVAHAFYYKGAYIHYDQYGTRRNINPSPEAATADERLHLDCSSFVNAVYCEAFGENVQPYPTTERSPQTGVMTEYAKNFYGKNPDVIGYYETADLDTEEKKSEFVEMVRSTLEVGDVIVYRRASSGHAIIYVGNGYFLHSTGSSYEYAVGDPHSAYDQADAKGTVSKLKLSSYLDDKTHGRYILAPNVVTVSILRPLARGLEMTDVTEARLTIPGISIEKSSNAPLRSAVYKGDAIVYTVTLKNNGTSDVDGITLTDYLPDGTEYIGGERGLVNNDGVLTYLTSLSAGEEISIAYAVKVVAEEAAEIVSKGNVNGVPLNELFNTVSVRMTENDAKALVSHAKEIICGARKFTDPIEAVKALYSEAPEIDLSSLDTAIGLIQSLIDTENKTYNAESPYCDLLVRGFYGGYDIRSGYFTDNERTRLPVERNLSIGDVIVAEYGDETVAEVYVYLGGGEFLSVTSASGEATLFTLESSLTKNLLVSLISFDRYVVIRPGQK